jgi:hypothetical protein
MFLSLIVLGLGLGCGKEAGADAVRSFEVVRRFEAAEARQGVAVDAEHFYPIDNRRIGKYDKRNGRRVASWDAAGDASIIHLNSGVVVDGKLYCAHSNYPNLPMASTIEVFDTLTLTRVTRRMLPTGYGSATWVDRREDAWWVAFANYQGRGGQPGKGPEATVLVRFDLQWNAVDSYTFPQQIIARFGTRSTSGGAWGNDGLLYATGHDAAELYIMRLPPHHKVLDLVGIVPASLEGQGISWDRSVPGMLYGIIKAKREVVLLRERRLSRTTKADQRSIEATSGK